MVDKLKNIADKLIKLLPVGNIICFESIPALSDNTKAVFDEMVCRGFNSKYKLVWYIEEDIDKADLPDIPNVFYVFENDKSLSAWLDKKIKFSRAKVFISCNWFFPYRKKNQHYIHLCHGAAFKQSDTHYQYPKYVEHAVDLSEYLMQYQAQSAHFPAESFLPLGYPRNDILFKNSDKAKKAFSDYSYEKLIYWMPTYRQSKSDGRNCSNISIPIIYNMEDAVAVNACAKDNHVLIVVKPHFAQDVSNITSLNLSNIIFIDNDFLIKHDILNYELLSESDALLSDYSSVYYDYLLKDRPIGLCWEDFEDYKSRNGFIVDPDYIMAGGEKIYTADDLCRFICNVADGKDVLKDKRNEIKYIAHKYADGNATKRVTDFIINTYL